MNDDCATAPMCALIHPPPWRRLCAPRPSGRERSCPGAGWLWCEAPAAARRPRLEAGGSFEAATYSVGPLGRVVVLRLDAAIGRPASEWSAVVYGACDELLDLVDLEQIGRQSARMLVEAVIGGRLGAVEEISAFIARYRIEGRVARRLLYARHMSAALRVHAALYEQPCPAGPTRARCLPEPERCEGEPGHPLAGACAAGGGALPCGWHLADWRVEARLGRRGAVVALIAPEGGVVAYSAHATLTRTLDRAEVLACSAPGWCATDARLDDACGPAVCFDDACGAAS